ncbi:hypothetical protein ESOMN_v1c03340 [Williamsoniiplasma somnilux]|uniref:Uncharacterized protein n=1 Tax=Williamsoniiplasma somnilux TaxID=215578 RepID=A0A2K8NYS9_9MOLU|nr:hypothetical protein ESOMN_v1c03340 [Williamsoniiplasma somnilux]
MLNETKNYKFWNIKTSFHKQIIRFVWQVNNNVLEEDNFSFNIVKYRSTNKYSFLKNNGINLTPTEDVLNINRSASDSYLTQTLKILRSFGIIKPGLPFYENVTNCFKNDKIYEKYEVTGIYEYRKNLQSLNNNNVLSKVFEYLLNLANENKFESRRFVYGIILGWIISKLDFSNEDYIEIMNDSGNKIEWEILELKKALENSSYISAWIDVVEMIAMRDEQIIEELKRKLFLK